MMHAKMECNKLHLRSYPHFILFSERNLVILTDFAKNNKFDVVYEENHFICKICETCNFGILSSAPKLHLLC